MKKWLSLILIVGLGFAGYSYYAKQKKRAARSQTTQIVEVKQGNLEDAVESTGVVEPLNRVEIKPPISGRIEKLTVEEGDVLRAAQIIGWMSSTDRAAVLDAARAKGTEEFKQWQDAYKPTPITAPLSGTLILRNVVVGQTVDAGTIIAAMSDKLIIKANVYEADIGRVRLGMPATVTLDSYPQEPIEGTVTQILQEGINVSNVITYPVKIVPTKVPAFLRSQMTANVRLIVNKKDDVLLIPTSAITRAADGSKQVLVSVPESKPVHRSVEVGMESTDMTEVKSGLVPGDRVLVVNQRYTPQQGAASSPLVMQNRRQGSSNRRGSGGPN